MNRENLIIREAKKKDIKSIAILLFGLKNQYGSCIERKEAEFILNYKLAISEAIDSQLNHIWVAELDSQLIGFMSFTERLVLRLGGRVITMEELFVKKEYRRYGVALSMYKSSTKSFRRLGLNHLEVVSSMSHPGQREWGRKIGLEWFSSIHRLKL